MKLRYERSPCASYVIFEYIVGRTWQFELRQGFPKRYAKDLLKGV